MKRRTRRTLNFIAFNLLFFSLYLNFIHKDSDKSLDPVLMQNTATSNATIVPKQVVAAPTVEKNEVKGSIN